MAATSPLPVAQASLVDRAPPLITHFMSLFTGSRDFYKQAGFEEVGEPIMLADGTVEGVSSPFLSLIT